ncbi:hypothetical protein MKZ38_009533 [Zalerion maritima]|uniref:Methyltransferase domain-containing protein n=1 Tax=Zalerion maritima TaxID=339359 RepID=A0AAD5RGB3_9PEZI|nr:hypothetical protein MKZ38_009533 [Zalerion maritima]
MDDSTISLTLLPTRKPPPLESESEDPIDLLLRCYKHIPEERKEIIIPQFRYRQRLFGPAVCNRLPSHASLNGDEPIFAVPPSSRVLEVGCGQGECTLVLARAVGAGGKVLGIDPAPGGYGEPFGIGESQEWILGSEMGRRGNVSFLRAQAPGVLAGGGEGRAGAREGHEGLWGGAREKPDIAVLCHSLWYFASVREVRETFEVLRRGGVQRVFLVEWDLALPEEDDEDDEDEDEDEEEEQEKKRRMREGAKRTGLKSRRERGEMMKPHYYAALVQRRLHELLSSSPSSLSTSLAPNSDDAAEKTNNIGTQQNVRTALSKTEIVQMAKAAGWSVRREGVIEMDEGMQDGKWEVEWVLSEEFEEALLRLGDGHGHGKEREELREIVEKEVRGRVRGVGVGKGQGEGDGNEDGNGGDKGRILCLDAFWVEFG